MKNNFFLKASNIFFLAVLLTIISCSKDDSVSDIEDTVETQTVDLTHLPFGGINPNNILIRSRGDSHPDILSLWLCGLPTNGAGAHDASDWTNPDGTWDYTRKPQVEGNVTWIKEHHNKVIELKNKT